MVVSAGSADKPTGEAERGCTCVTGTVLAGNLVALSSFQDLVHFNQSIDEEHSGKGAGFIACHSNNTATLGTLQLLVPLLSQQQLLDAPPAVGVEAGQGLGLMVGL